MHKRFASKLRDAKAVLTRKYPSARASFLRRLPLLGYLLLTAGFVAGGSLIIHEFDEDNKQARINQQAGCERGNDLRRQVNTQQILNLRSIEISYELLRARGSRAADEEIKGAAQEFKDLLESYEPLPIVDCKKAYTPNSDD